MKKNYCSSNDKIKNAYVFSGYYISKDKTSIIGYILYCKNDGSLNLASYKNRYGSWKERKDDALLLTIDGTTYEAKKSDDGLYYDFIYPDTVGSMKLEIAMRCKIGNDSLVYTETDLIRFYKDEIGKMKKQYADVKGGIIFYGGSNFVRWETLVEDMTGFPVYNKSFGGSSDVTRKYYAPDLLYDSAPDMVVFMSSTNDWTKGNSLEQVIEIKKDFYEEVAENLPDTAIVIMSATPNPLRYFGDYHDGMVACDEWLAKYCAQHDNFYFLDCRNALSKDNGAEPIMEYWGADNLHLTAEGYKHLAQMMKDGLSAICQERNLNIGDYHVR